MKYNANIHHRRSIRLKGYDYSRAGLYFITICCQNRGHFLGVIEDYQMILNDAGKMIEKWFNALENKFPTIKNHTMIVMPNHFHCIIEIVRPTPPDPTIAVGVGADLRVCPNDKNERVCPNRGEHVGSPLHVVIQWFKTMTTNEYIRGVKKNGWRPFDGKLWQRNYWERIIRNNNEYIKTSRYIINNPLKWHMDVLNGDGNKIMETQFT